MLFSVGVFLALVLNLLQVQRNVTLFPPDVISSIFSSAWWVPPCCGSASGKGARRRRTRLRLSSLDTFDPMDEHLSRLRLFPSCISTIRTSRLFLLSAVIGLLYPCIDRCLGKPHKFKREWSSVMRCVAVFVGINHASAVSFSFCQSAVSRPHSAEP